MGTWLASFQALAERLLQRIHATSAFQAMLNLKVIIVSTRPGRQGLAIGNWFNSFAEAHGKYEVELLDLAKIDLPFIDESNHPMRRQYEHQHTKDWSARIDQADAIVFVMPEYNYGVGPTMVNAIDYLYHEWNYKPVGMVSYGGISGGLRAQQMAKLMFTAVKMMPIPESVPIPFFPQYIKDGIFTSNELIDKSGKTMLDEMAKWADALKPMRSSKT
jgi:NAD(P)H-dependent FMN reductase